MVVKQFTEILAREKKRAFTPFSREEKVQTPRVGLALKGGFESFIEFQKAMCRQRGWSGASQVALVVKKTHLPIQET